MPTELLETPAAAKEPVTIPKAILGVEIDTPPDKLLEAAFLRNEIDTVAEELEVDKSQYVAALTLLETIKDHHLESYLHSMRVTLGGLQVTRQLAEILVNNGQIHAAEAQSLSRDTFIAGLVHDVGKTQVPLSVLAKDGRFDETDWTHMQKHASAGYHTILSTPGLNQKIARPAGSHHFIQQNPYGEPLEGLSVYEKAMIDAIAIADKTDARLTRNDGYIAEPDYLSKAIEDILAQDHYKDLGDKTHIAMDLINKLVANWYELRDRIEVVDDHKLAAA